MQTKELKPKRCKQCGAEFVPMRSTAIACSYRCAKAWVDARSEKLAKQREQIAKKIDRQLTKERKEALKTRSEWLKEAQVVFNRYIRERDKDLPCVSCVQHRNSYDAGHYRSVGAAPQLRFNEDNVHKQCVHCNQHKSGNAIDYRINLVKRIGIERVEKLESDNEPAKFTIEDAKEIKKLYNEKLKLLKQ